MVCYVTRYGLSLGFDLVRYVTRYGLRYGLGGLLGAVAGLPDSRAAPLLIPRGALIRAGDSDDLIHREAVVGEQGHGFRRKAHAATFAAAMRCAWRRMP